MTQHKDHPRQKITQRIAVTYHGNVRGELFGTLYFEDENVRKSFVKSVMHGPHPANAELGAEVED